MNERNTFDRNSQSPELWHNHGCALCQTERYQEAIAAFDKAIALNRNYCQAWNNRGNALSALKRYAEALSSYDKAVALNPRYHQGWFNRGLLLAEMQAYGNALQSYERAIALHPDPLYIHAKETIWVKDRLFTTA